MWKVPAHSYNLEKTYGYKKIDTREAYVQALRELYRGLIPLIRDGLCGAIYTQVSDVEDETNGLFTFDRAVLKLQPDDLTSVMNDMDSAIAKTE